MQSNKTKTYKKKDGKKDDPIPEKFYYTKKIYRNSRRSPSPIDKTRIIVTDIPIEKEDKEDNGGIVIQKLSTTILDSEITGHLAFYQKRLRNLKQRTKKDGIAKIDEHQCKIYEWNIQFKTGVLRENAMLLVEDINCYRDMLGVLDAKSDRHYTRLIQKLEGKLNVIREELNADELIVTTQQGLLMFLLIHKYDKTVLSALNYFTLVDIAKMCWNAVPKY